uniref:TRAF3-interacting protein 1 n=1 Tax=Euplotes harpa TaxID=151035 RepID=A0A7S3JDP4_9SPIT|mmetsp:Transcript_34190/g.39468  ORF Transcript_34190/g.39468 Transcript_34190/m.39468 type:complete len:448 (+) Transcript_34190:15-1358(+)
MGDDFWKPTADCFQQLFSKPKMTEKLLQRPPFRYIHDIYTATMQATGFGDGLYSEEELDAKSIKDKDGKVNFLDKLIALVQMAAGEEIDVKSSKIVAGQEPEATNIFLQYLFKVATSGIDSGPIVAQILGEGGGEGQAEEDDGEAEAEAARRAAEEEEQRKKEKRAAKKKQMEDEKAKQQQEEERQRKAEQEKKAKQEAEEAAKKSKAKKAAPPPQQPAKKKEPEAPPPPAKHAIIEEGDDDNEENIIVDEEDNDVNAGIDINEVDPESKFGRKALAQLRAQEEEEAENNNIADDGAGTGIRMGKIGRRGKKKAGGVERSEPQKKVLQQPDLPQRSFGGYGEEDIEFMRKAIQSLCQSTNPLGKSIDFVTEDIDSMIKEYDHWKQDYITSQAKLEEQQRITEQTLQPLQDVTLAQLEERIREEKSKIQNLRSQIIRNDSTIQNLLIQ